MTIATAPALLIGLGARILLDTYSRTEEPSIKDFLLIGVWQGVALYYAGKHRDLAIFVALGFAGKLFIDFNAIPDVTKCITTIIGVVLGVVGTDLLSQYANKFIQSDRRRKKDRTTTRNRDSKRQRIVQFKPNVQGSRVENVVPHPHTLISDITSVDSNSELIGPKSSMSPLEREIAALRARASLADSERRRYKEERKWAISQGNLARASQMKWEYKRYTTLMESCHREADAKLLEASNVNSKRVPADEHKPAATRERSSCPLRELPASGQPTRPDHKYTRPRRISAMKPIHVAN